MKSTATGGADAWPSDRYLNLWVCPLGSNLLGYAQFPGGPAATDGVVILHSAFGNTGTAAPPFNLGRTATHEIGHWLDLHHIWGDDGTGCSGSDFVADTPNQAGPNYGTPVFPSITCANGPTGDMFMNYMDYVDDAAMVMFTTGPVTRMQAALDGARTTIGTPIPCGKALSKDLGKDHPKDLIKEPPKDFPKDHPKDLIKEPPKDFPKDPPKDLPKDFGKDSPKDLAKDPILEAPKNLAADFPPKSFSDPPKSFMEPPVDFPGLFGQPVTAGGGGMPFVLATPSAIGGGGARAGMGLAVGYLELIGQFAKLHARGLLDSEGLAAWQQAVAAYQQLSRGTGGGAGG